MQRILRTGLLLACVVVTPALHAEDRPGRHAVASAHPLATAAGIEILKDGGNAFDAAVAVSATLAVVEPTGSGLGGGGFWLLHRAADDFETFIDGRETAPFASTETMFQDAGGKAIDAASRDGPRAAGIPGEPAALDHLARRYGKLTLARDLAPAIRVAREGFACDPKLAKAFQDQWTRLSPVAQAAFGGNPPATGDMLRQPDLAAVLQRLANVGASDFYLGDTASLLLTGVRAAGGIWTDEDLRRYRVVERPPVETWFRDVRVVTAPPPSAGGITLGETLHQLEALGWRGAAGIDAKHLVVESLRRAYRDRAAALGDSDFVPVPAVRLLSTTYARQLAATIVAGRATPSATLAKAVPGPEGFQTTHFSVLDADGNRVAGTLSINLPFGSGFMAPGTGLFLNDEMDDFAASTTASNAYGLVGSAANRVQPGKRPLSSMTPTFAEGPHGLLIAGTPGGSRIITMVLLGLLSWTEGADAQAIVAQPRYHHQYLPDEIQFEPGAFTPEEQAALQARGHALKPLTSPYGNMHVITWDPHTKVVSAASDPRGVGGAQVVEP